MFFHYLKFYQRYIGIRLYLIFVATVLGVVSETIGITVFLPFLQSSEELSGSFNQSSDAVTVVVSWLESVALYIALTTDVSRETGLLLLMTLLFVMKGIMMFLSLMLKAYFRADFIGGLKSEIFSAVDGCSFSKLSNKSSSEIASLANEQVTRAVSSFNYFLLFCSFFFTSIVYLAFAVFISPLFGLLLVLAGGVIFLLFRAINRRASSASADVTAGSVKLTERFAEFFRNIKFLRVTSLSQSFHSLVKRDLEQLVAAERRLGVLAGFTAAVREPFAIIIIVAILAYFVEVRGVAIGTLIVSVLLFYRGVNAFMNVQNYWQGALEFGASVSLIDSELITMKRWVETPEKATDLRKGVWKRLDVRDLTYAHPGTLSPVFSNLNLTLPMCGLVGIVGESGSGKSTLLHLLSGLLKPDSGDLFIAPSINGISERVGRWGDVSFLGQEIALFRGSLAENLRFGLNRSVTDLEILDILERVNLYDWVQGLTEGLNTQIGEAGLNISGGQKQRLSLARELLREPAILFLDEPTSALDENSELAFQEIVCELGKTRLVVQITHNMDLVKHFDLVIKVKNGRAVIVSASDDLNHLLGTSRQ